MQLYKGLQIVTGLRKGYAELFHDVGTVDLPALIDSRADPVNALLFCPTHDPSSLQ